MNKIILLLSIVSFLSLTSCEEVVTVDLETAPAKLVIDASINWEKGTTGAQQIIKLTTTTGYYSNVIPTISGATVFITNSSNTVFNFMEEVPNTGQYICNNFVPLMGETYVLTVNYAGQNYTATEKMVPVPDIISVAQRDDAGFSGEDIEVKFFFQDNGLEANSYLMKYSTPVNAFPQFEAFDDRFEQGNQMFGLYSHEDLKAGDTIDFTLYGISTQYYNYMDILIGIANGGNGPFQTPPATLRGNIVNQTNQDNYCLGYFRLCEVDKMQYVVQ
ncbi:MAG: DUF4249 domain-containing protein [Flavobacterium sp. JAD_PAG50586_2]|nr:MAG: DUF4249 domain-containing protein [Flavobacterium sp. JAD_PAG50586_2]